MSENLRGSGGVSLPDSPQEIACATPYLEAFTAVSEIRSVMPGSKLADLFSWFPTPEHHEALVEAPGDRKAEQVVSFLGSTVNAYDRVRFLHIFRPQDRSDLGTDATDLGLERDEAGVVQPIAMATIYKIEAYTNYIIDTLLQGNLALVASKISTAGQAVGFHLRFMDDVNSGKRLDSEKMRITFTDGSPAIDDHIDAILYIDDISRQAHVDVAKYDPQTDSFEVRLAKRDQERY